MAGANRDEATAFLGVDAGADVQVFPENNVDTLEESIRVRVLGLELQLTLLMVRPTNSQAVVDVFPGVEMAEWDAAVAPTMHECGLSECAIV